MGNWNITIQGMGQHHSNGDNRDADMLAREFVSALKKSGQSIEAAYFTGGSREWPDIEPRPMDDQFKLERIACVCYEVNAAYCLGLGDEPQPSWSDAPGWQRALVRDGVHFHLGNPGAGQDQSHENWMKRMIEQGWKLGPVKDPAKKEHPCLVPFHELPPEQRAKDYIFRAIVHALRPIFFPHLDATETERS